MTIILAHDYADACRIGGDAGLTRMEIQRCTLLTGRSQPMAAAGWRPTHGDRVLGGTFEDMVARWEQLRGFRPGMWSALFGAFAVSVAGDGGAR